jgi:hypothetical protein
MKHPERFAENFERKKLDLIADISRRPLRGQWFASVEESRILPHLQNSSSERVSSVNLTKREIVNNRGVSGIPADRTKETKNGVRFQPPVAVGVVSRPPGPIFDPAHLANPPLAQSNSKVSLTFLSHSIIEYRHVQFFNESAKCRPLFPHFYSRQHSVRCASSIFRGSFQCHRGSNGKGISRWIP